MAQREGLHLKSKLPQPHSLSRYRLMRWLKTVVPASDRTWTWPLSKRMRYSCFHVGHFSKNSCERLTLVGHIWAGMAVSDLARKQWVVICSDPWLASFSGVGGAQLFTPQGSRRSEPTVFMLEFSLFIWGNILINHKHVYYWVGPWNQVFV